MTRWLMIGLCANQLGCAAQARDGDGLGLSLTQIRAAFPTCELKRGDRTLDLHKGCADGACADQTYAEMDSATRGGAICTTSSVNPTHVSCAWSSGITAPFQGEDGSPSRTAKANQIFVKSAFSGTTAEGMGIGVSMGCFIDAFGEPEELSVEKEGDRYIVSSMLFHDPHIYLDDGRGPDTPDGMVDHMGLRGPR
jgi:hypothetical protein